ncbi:MAG: hypothetical protein KF819_33565 [Labilithrix sp.]|nr:hypothetical protein [Labilithrix sp.]
MRTHLFTALLLASLTVTACSSSHEAAGETPDPGGPNAENPKAPPVSGTPSDSELTEDFGVFVSKTGNDANTGARPKPFATIGAGIAEAKRVGKRVYVCAGTYHESITVQDSISIIGSLDCSTPTWKSSTNATRVESPSSPAMRATDITSPTRIEGLMLLAPNATASSGSSIGLVAERASGLVIARSRIMAGNAASGEDGVEGVQLSNGATVRGAAYVPEAECVQGGVAQTCTPSVSLGWLKPKGGAGGVGACMGEAGHDGEAGGNGGSGGLHEPYYNGSALRFMFRYFDDKVSNGPELGVVKQGVAGTAGTDGANANTIGVFSAEGYTPADGVPGTSGAPGKGGYGGRGANPQRDPNATPTNGVWRGIGGAGGGAGGCPGLAGTAGTGGGASVAALLIDSPVVIDDSTLVASSGGHGGRGALGSVPTAGGAPGNVAAGIPAIVAGAPGGRGGAAGVSGNGAPGPSVGIAYKGAAPKLLSTSSVTRGNGGVARDAQTRTDGFGNVKTVPAMPAGVSQDILAL